MKLSLYLPSFYNLNEPQVKNTLIRPTMIFV